ncbi:MAG TPA: GAF domain-containing protein [Anaerolineaceae bacterium]|nr:GAF domain-containing protein [Anaerolineaceae bacterium]
MMSLRKWFPTRPDGDSSLQSLREQTLTGVLRVAVLITAPLYLLALAGILQTGSLITAAVISLLFAGLVIAALLRALPFAVKAHSVLAIALLTSLLRLITTGLNAEAGLFLIAYVLLAVLLLGYRSGIAALATVLAAFAVTGFGMRWGLIPQPVLAALPDSTSGADWVFYALVFSVLASLLGFSLHTLLQAFDAVTRRRDALNAEFDEERRLFEQRITEQTVKLDLRTCELEAVTSIAQDLAQGNRMDALLQTAPDLILSHFGYDHAGIYLLDETGDYAVLQAASSEAGQRLLANGHRLRKGEEGIVGRVAASGLWRIATAADADAALFDSYRLPAMRAQIALPLKTSERIIGVLEIQSATADAFSQDDVTMLQAIADQLAIAIDRAQKAEQMQARMEELEATARQYTEKAWQAYLGSRAQSYAYNAASDSLTAESTMGAEAEQAITTGVPVILTETDQSGAATAKAAIPIKLRDQTLGVLTLRFNTPSVSPEMLEFVSTVAERMALSLETARLLEEIQVRADREHLVSDITAKVRSATNIENILQTTAVELGRKLGLRDVFVQLSPEDET